MHEPTEAEIAKYSPRYSFNREINFEDQWRGQWIPEEELPEDGPVNHAYAVVLMKKRGYVTRKKGEELWQAVEVAMEPGDDPEAMIKEAVFQQTGITPSQIWLNGYFDCTPTKFNKEVPADAVRLRALYTVAAGSVDDVPEDSGYQRRRLPVNEYGPYLRQRYPEILQYIRAAIDLYVVKEINGEL